MASSSQPRSRLPVSALLLLLLTVSSSSAARLLASSSAAAPTPAHIKAEVQSAAKNISTGFPNFSKFANLMKQAVNLKGYDYSALKYSTILAPNNDAMTALLKKIPMKQENLPKAYNVTAFHVITKKYALAALSNAALNRAYPTMLKQPIVKKSAAKAASGVSFGVQGSTDPKTWAKVVQKAVYVGKYFVVHGVDKYLVPKGTTV